MDLLQQLIQRGIAHKGFAFIDVLQICATFFNMTDYYDPRIYELSSHNAADFEAACMRSREWDYNRDAPIALGLFYERLLPTFDDRFRSRSMDADERGKRIREIIEARR
jgi:2-oxoglutarate ferredoxin oxidoreductase subunit beta